MMGSDQDDTIIIPYTAAMKRLAGVTTLKDEHRQSERRVEGVAESRWILMDYGDFLVHVMDEDSRRHYNLEELWAPPAAKRRARTADRAAA